MIPLRLDLWIKCCAVFCLSPAPGWTADNRIVILLADVYRHISDSMSHSLKKTAANERTMAAAAKLIILDLTLRDHATINILEYQYTLMWNIVTLPQNGSQD